MGYYGERQTQTGMRRIESVAGRGQRLGRAAIAHLRRCHAIKWARPEANPNTQQLLFHYWLAAAAGPRS